ncbi:hypothetical protein KDA23_00275 [Candidatus Saccharibacteria bacterium]|nr:hypothetical protein [Candidatus Saccharibacteria bacterium]
MPQFKVIPGTSREGVSSELSGGLVPQEALALQADLEEAMRLLGPMPVEPTPVAEQTEQRAA